MTTTIHRKKRSAPVDLQAAYESSIRDDDVDTFSDLITREGVDKVSHTALQLAGQSKKNFYLKSILEKMKPEDLRILTAKQSISEGTIKQDLKKSKTTAKPAKNNVVEKIVSQWPFKPARVVWTDDFTTKREEKPPTQAESKEKWTRLFAVAQQFWSNIDAQNEIFSKVDELSASQAGQSLSDAKFAEKLLNARQSVRLCFRVLSFIPSMIFTLSSRNDPEAPSTTCDFFELLDKYSIVIPKASNFKGRGPIFASCFMQHLNTTSFEGLDVVVTKIEYQAMVDGEEEEEEENDNVETTE